jgi:hypothetical protein
MFNVGQRDIAGYEGLYAATLEGRILNVRTGKLLKGSPNPGGYLLVALHKCGEQKTFSVHRLIASSLIPNPDGKPSVNHIDGCKTNNAVANLEWCTPKENTLHGVALGLITGVEPKLTPEQHEEIRAHKARGWPTQYLAGHYRVSATTIKNVLHGRYRAKGEPLTPKTAEIDA